MPTRPDNMDPLDRFAELSALLDDPFADRAEILGTAGVAPEDWATVEDAWAARFAASDGDVLAARFAEVYQLVRERRPSGAPASGTTPHTAPASSPPPRPLGAPLPAPNVARTDANPLAGTIEMDARHVRAPLPFCAAPPGGVQLPPSRPVPPPLLTELGGTLPTPTGVPRPEPLPWPTKPKS